MRRDGHGYFYCVDRVGDTFRWKGENVSTGEVGEALAAVPGILEANVYGVMVPGVDGRAGMASLAVNGVFALDDLPLWLKGKAGGHAGRTLAAYARPIFLRLAPNIVVTGTFKQRKFDLVCEGFDPVAISDPLYFRDPASSKYERLTKERYADIVEGRVKL